MMLSNYENALSETLDIIQKNPLLHGKIQFIALLGSVDDEEAVSNYSDLDILLILKSDNYGYIELSVLNTLKEISEKITTKYSLELSLLCHTIFDFEEYVDFNYLIHYSWGRVLVGNSDHFKQIFKKIIERKYSDRNRKDLIYYNIIHARFNLLRKYASWNGTTKSDYKKFVTKLTINNILEITDWALVYKNIYSKTKKEICSNFKIQFPDIRHATIPKEALEIRSLWNTYDFSSSQLDIFLEDAIEFVQEIVKYIYEIHKKN